MTVLELVDGRSQERATVNANESYTAAAPFTITITPGCLLDDLA